MAEKDQVFSSKVKSTGIFLFKDFYKFCYDWLTEEGGFDVAEEKYSEKIIGNSKDIDIEWVGTKKVTDYFKFEVKVVFQVIGLTDVEVNQNEVKVRTNKGTVSIKITGNLIKDYDGKWEKSPFLKMSREVYEKYIIKSKVDALANKLAGNCDEFLSQTKAWLALEGRK